MMHDGASGSGRGVAIVGASDGNFWAGQVRQNLERHGYTGAVWPVNPNYPSVGGLPCVGSLEEVPGQLDVVVVAVAAQRSVDIVAQAASLGAADIVVVANGFAEQGREAVGADLERRLQAAAGTASRLLGPNCVGFADFRRSLCVVAQPIPEVQLGDISVISQSGALLTTIMAAITEDGGGLDWCASLGNAAAFDLAAAIEHVVVRGTTTAIAVYAESLGTDPERLSRALQRARDADITVAMVKAGRSRVATRIASSHTASVAGDDAQVDAFLEAHGVLRVESVEDLARVAVLARAITVPVSGGVLVAGSSGGVAALAGDLAQQEHLHLATLAEETRDALLSAVEPGSFLDNPLDLVGRPGQRKHIEDIYRLVYDDPNVDVVVYPWPMTFPDDSQGRAAHRASIELAARTGHASGKPTVITSVVDVEWTPWARELREAHPGVSVVRGLHATVRALARMFPAPTAQPSPEASSSASTVTGEAEGRRLLRALDLPLVAGVEREGVQDLLEAAADLVPPFVLKVDVRGLAHRSRAGLVVLGIDDVDALAGAAATLRDRLDQLGVQEGDVAGYLVQEMAEGRELLVGLSRSPLGRFLTVGVGGVAAGHGSAATTLHLPIDTASIAGAIACHLGVSPTSHGVGEATTAITTLCAAFVDGTLDAYDTVELNPVLVSPTRAQIVDVLMVQVAPDMAEAGPW